MMCMKIYAFEFNSEYVHMRKQIRKIDDVKRKKNEQNITQIADLMMTMRVSGEKRRAGETKAYSKKCVLSLICS